MGSAQAGRARPRHSAAGPSGPGAGAGCPRAGGPSTSRSGRVSSNQRSSSSSWPWKSIGMPGAVSVSAEPRVARFWANQLAASPGAISSGRRTPPVGHLVVRLGVDDPLERPSPPASDRAGHGADVALPSSGTVRACRTTSQERQAPTATRSPPRRPRSGPCHAGLAAQVLGDGQLPGLARRDLVVQPGHERPAIGQRRLGRAVDGPDVERRSRSAGHPRGTPPARSGRCRAGRCAPRRGRSRAGCRPRA